MGYLPRGFCQCGCGGKTNLAKYTENRKGWTKGEPVSFLPGHNLRLLDLRGSNGTNWKGGTGISNGYKYITVQDHPKANNGYVKEATIVAEKALGKYLPDGAIVHHINEDRLDNRNSNLVICENHAYHQILHARKRAFDACGHANWRQCQMCKRWDALENLFIHPKGQAYHCKRIGGKSCG